MIISRPPGLVEQRVMVLHRKELQERAKERAFICSLLGTLACAWCGWVDLKLFGARASRLLARRRAGDHKVVFKIIRGSPQKASKSVGGAAAARPAAAAAVAAVAAAAAFVVGCMLRHASRLGLAKLIFARTAQVTRGGDWTPYCDDSDTPPPPTPATAARIEPFNRTMASTHIIRISHRGEATFVALCSGLVRRAAMPRPAKPSAPRPAAGRPARPLTHRVGRSPRPTSVVTT